MREGFIPTLSLTLSEGEGTRIRERVLFPPSPLTPPPREGNERVKPSPKEREQEFERGFYTENFMIEYKQRGNR